MKQRDLVRLLERNGFKKIRDDGNHIIYQAPNKRSVQVPRHRELNENTARQIIRNAGLK